MKTIKKQCDIILLPTDLETNVIKDKGKFEYIENKQVAKTINSIVEGFFVYVIRIDEIEEGEWLIFHSLQLGWPPKLYKHLGLDANGFIKVYEDMAVDPMDCKKVIATTNPELKIYEAETLASASGFNLKTDDILLPKPSDEFIQQWIAKGCPKKINVDYEEITTGQCNCLCHKSGYTVLHVMACCHPTTHTSVKVLNNIITCSFIEEDEWDRLHTDWYKNHAHYCCYNDYLKMKFNPPTKKE